MEKIQKTSRIINKILSVLFWIAIVSLGIVLLLIIVLFAAKDTGTIQTLTLGDYRLTLAEGLSVKNPVLTIGLIAILPVMIFTCYEFKVLKSIFTPMAEGLPFSGSVSKAIRKLAWFKLASGLIGAVLNFITSRMLYQSLDIVSLFDPEKVTACSLTDSSSEVFMAALVSFFLLLLLSHVFRYGEELQKLSDETL